GHGAGSHGRQEKAGTHDKAAKEDGLPGSHFVLEAAAQHVAHGENADDNGEGLAGGSRGKTVLLLYVRLEDGPDIWISMDKIDDSGRSQHKIAVPDIFHLISPLFQGSFFHYTLKYFLRTDKSKGVAGLSRCSHRKRER